MQSLDWAFCVPSPVHALAGMVPGSRAFSSYKLKLAFIHPAVEALDIWPQTVFQLHLLFFIFMHTLLQNEPLRSPNRAHLKKKKIIIPWLLMFPQPRALFSWPVQILPIKCFQAAFPNPCSWKGCLPPCLPPSCRLFIICTSLVTHNYLFYLVL